MAQLIDTLVREMKRQDNINVRTEYAAYDDMDNMIWKLPPPLSEMLEMRIDISSAPHDHLKTGCDIFNTHVPQIEILPKGPADIDFAKQREVWAEWQVAQSNQRGEKEWTREVLEQSLKYSHICAQVDYLPYWLPEESMRTKEQKAQAAVGGDFCVTLFHPSSAYGGFGKYGLTWAGTVQVKNAIDVAEHWSVYQSDMHPSIASAIAKLRDFEDENVGVVDITSFQRRYVAVVPIGDSNTVTAEQIENEGNRIVILDSDNPLSFINWTIVQGRNDPLLAPLHRSGLWNNQNLIQSINTSTTLKYAMPPVRKHTSLGGKKLQERYDGTQSTIELDASIGEDVENMVLPELDNRFLELLSRNENRMGTQTGLRNLNNVDPVGNIQYATLDAFINLSMTRLQPAVRLAEKAMNQILALMFLWVKESKTISKAYIMKKGDKQGRSVDLSAEKFDPATNFIKVTFGQNKVGGKMQDATYYSTLKQSGAPIAWSNILEKLGEGVSEVLMSDFVDEEIVMTALQAYKDKKMLDVQLQSQAAMGAMQAQAQQGTEPAQQGQTPIPFDQMQGQENNPAVGGTPPAMGAPELTQTQIPPGGA